VAGRAARLCSGDQVADRGRPGAALAGGRGAWHQRERRRPSRGRPVVHRGHQGHFPAPSGPFGCLPGSADRRRAHHALAEATDPGTDPNRRAWPQAAAGPDEDVAAELERSAGRAQARGGFAAAAAFLERATRLIPEPARRGVRALAAARAMFDAAALDHASELLATAEMTPLDELQRARVDVLRGQIAFCPDAR